MKMIESRCGIICSECEKIFHANWLNRMLMTKNKGIRENV